MLLIPYQTRFTPKSLPLVTLGLILVNALVYFVFQSGDRQAYTRAAEYYFSSELAQIELPRYATYLERRNDRGALQVLRMIRAGARPEQSVQLMLAVENDREFMRDLRDGAVVPSSDPAYATWREQRSQFNALIGRVFTERFALEPDTGGPAWGALRLLTYQFLHGNAVHWLGNMIVLLLAGPFAEAALGRFRFLIAFIASGVFAGAVHMLFSDQTLVGASGSIAGAMAMVAVLYGTRKVPVFYWLFVYFNTARIPALLLLPVWLLIEAVQWAASPEARVSYAAHIGGFLAGGVLAWLLRPSDTKKVDRILDEQFADERRSDRKSTLLQEAQAAAARLDTRKAARAYGELLQDDPTNVQHATAYFNMALLGRNQDTLLDATLRVLWIRARGARSELRPVYLQMSQPHVLAALPVDEQLRLARRLVATREDAAALRVLDGLLASETLKNLYSRQIADCLLGLFTTYSRHGLRQPAEDVKRRLSTHFPSPATLGGLPPTQQPPMTIRGATHAPRPRVALSGPPSDMELDLDTQLRTRWGPDE
ncbi:MAG TPA: rhomboid family intramembrane serine protease [Burkholderiaceae bacterium]|nr:rhomboid family intramembrane serine protease [Burkholderiaceae bacterium]